MKRLLAVGVLVGSLAIGVSNVSASQTFSSHLYRGHSSCSTGATDTSGSRYGTFAVTGVSSHVVSAYVSTDNLAPFRQYNVSIYEWGHSCILMQYVTAIFTDGGGHATVHFQFWQHTGETVAWAWIQHGTTTDIVKSTALPING
jgi:hypothetical protein